MKNSISFLAALAINNISTVIYFQMCMDKLAYLAKDRVIIAKVSPGLSLHSKCFWQAFAISLFFSVHKSQLPCSYTEP